jgi:hypothetical protein
VGSPPPRRSWHDEEGDELGEEAGESNPFTELGAAFKKRGSDVPELLRQVTVVLALVPRAGLAFARIMRDKWAIAHAICPYAYST